MCPSDLTHFSDFNGRARRKEYWMFALWNAIIVLVIGALFGFLGRNGSGIEVGIMMQAVSIYNLLVLIPSVAVAVRRVHDMGKSGFWVFLGFVPVIGWIWLLIYLVTDSTKGDNEYGPNPKTIGNMD